MHQRTISEHQHARLQRLGAAAVRQPLSSLGVDPEAPFFDDGLPNAEAISAIVLSKTVGQVIPNTTYAIYIPADPSTSSIHRGSGIVGVSDGDGRVSVHFQDDAFGSMPTWADRLFQAAARRTECAPTIATAALPEADLIMVGEYDARRERIEMIRMSMIPVILDWLQVPNEQFVREEIHRSGERGPRFAS